MCCCQVQHAVAEPCLPLSSVMLIQVRLAIRQLIFMRCKIGDLSETTCSGKWGWVASRYLNKEGEVGGIDGWDWFSKSWEVALK